jgi:hypothetical protein
MTINEFCGMNNSANVATGFTSVVVTGQESFGHKQILPTNHVVTKRNRPTNLTIKDKKYAAK